MIRARILLTLKPADMVWLLIAVIVVGYDGRCHPDATLSKAVDRYLSRRPWLTRAIVVLTACHLINIWPKWVDPWEWLFYLRTPRP